MVALAVSAAPLYSATPFSRPTGSERADQDPHRESSALHAVRMALSGTHRPMSPMPNLPATALDVLGLQCTETLDESPQPFADWWTELGDCERPPLKFDSSSPGVDLDELELQTPQLDRCDTGSDAADEQEFYDDDDLIEWESVYSTPEVLLGPTKVVYTFP
jgi:hypothetical protein